MRVNWNSLISWPSCRIIAQCSGRIDYSERSNWQTMVESTLGCSRLEYWLWSGLIDGWSNCKMLNWPEWWSHQIIFQWPKPNLFFLMFGLQASSCLYTTTCLINGKRFVQFIKTITLFRFKRMYIRKNIHKLCGIKVFWKQIRTLIEFFISISTFRLILI